MALMQFFAQMGMIRIGPMLITMPDEMDEGDRITFTEYFRTLEQLRPNAFERDFAGLNENQVVEKVSRMAEEMMNARYPMPREQVITSFNGFTFSQKDYYLPTLKVFNYRDGEFYSPARTAKWKNLELRAEHLEVIDIYPKYEITKNKTHKVGLDCDCGIYGSVNVEELSTYFHSDMARASLIQLDPNFMQSERKLCIIEPSTNSQVYIARKGWKTTKAFISEIVGETISIPDASELLSMVWQRKVDVEKVYNRPRFE